MNRLLCVAVLAATVLGGCGSGTGGSSHATPARATTSRPPATTSTTALPTTLPPLHLTSSFAAATHLIDAWKHNDRASAGQAATAAAVGSLFAQPYLTTQSRGCDSGSPESDCFYRLGSSGALRVHVTREADGSWLVTEVSLAG